eukprot:m.353153 g.353153  ORF g.353153 m.353153 type:complete len:156 (-) comp16696_c0_seq1:32-499(-)
MVLEVWPVQSLVLCKQTKQKQPSSNVCQPPSTFLLPVLAVFLCLLIPVSFVTAKVRLHCQVLAWSSLTIQHVKMVVLFAPSTLLFSFLFSIICLDVSAGSFVFHIIKSSGVCIFYGLILSVDARGVCLCFVELSAVLGVCYACQWPLCLPQLCSD